MKVVMTEPHEYVHDRAAWGVFMAELYESLHGRAAWISFMAEPHGGPS